MPKLSYIGYAMTGFSSCVFLGFLGGARAIAPEAIWIVVAIVAFCLIAGLFNFAGYVAKGWRFSEQTLILGMLPGLAIAIGFLILINLGVSLGTR
jgi:hypothetical protein